MPTKKKVKKQSTRAYIKKHGYCPFCGSGQIGGGSFDLECYPDQYPVVEQRVECLTCEKSWIDTYKLVGYTEFYTEV